MTVTIQPARRTRSGHRLIVVSLDLANIRAVVMLAVLASLLVAGTLLAVLTLLTACLPGYLLNRSVWLSAADCRNANLLTSLAAAAVVMHLILSMSLNQMRAALAHGAISAQITWVLSGDPEDLIEDERHSCLRPHPAPLPRGYLVPPPERPGSPGPLDTRTGYSTYSSARRLRGPGRQLLGSGCRSWEPDGRWVDEDEDD